MVPVTLVLTERVRVRLLEAVDRAGSSWRTCAPFVQVLRERVAGARIVAEEALPADRVMPGDRVRLVHLRPHFREVLKLDIAPAGVLTGHTLSVISPLGVELLGARLGEVVHWFADEGPRQAVVEEIVRAGASGAGETEESGDAARADCRCEDASNLAPA